MNVYPILIGPASVTASVHSLFDGWSLAAAQEPGFERTALLLSLAAGAFVYLGYHAIDSQYQRRRGAIPVLSALIGAAALRLGIGG
jgi:hypothetical protein